MDKIDLTRWNDYFGNTQQSLLYASDRYQEALFSFSEKGLPTGQIKTLSTPGLTLTELKLHTAQPFRLCDSQSTESAESLFVLNGDVESNFDAYHHPLSFSRHHQSIQYNPHFRGTHLVRSNHFHALTISYDLDYLVSLLPPESVGPLEDMAGCIQKKQCFLSTPYAMKVSERIAEVIHAIQHCAFTGTTRYVYLESKMMELFVLQMEHLNALQNGSPADNRSRIDLEKLHAVREYIDSAYLESFSLRDLVLRFGLNEFKLKKGYKELFGSTVFGHVHQLRMQEAKTLLTRKQMNVSEVAFHIGYNNVSSFSTEFKKRFGYTPKMAS